MVLDDGEDGAAHGLPLSVSELEGLVVDLAARDARPRAAPRYGARSSGGPQR